MRAPTSPAVAIALTILFSVTPYEVWKRYSTAGSTPQEPQVGAVTIVPPEAFSSETASAYANSSPRRCMELL